jgi:hypothetical protein
LGIPCTHTHEPAGTWGDTESVLLSCFLGSGIILIFDAGGGGIIGGGG